MDYEAASHVQAGRKNNAKSLYGILDASLVVSGYSPQRYQGFIQDFLLWGGDVLEYSLMRNRWCVKQILLGRSGGYPQNFFEK